ncbi:hypothetical protein UT300007_25060 [Clostridium sp. CTA-7]
MSTFVLKREYALQMPKNYVEIDREEMEYVDGGAEKINYWWGYAINLSAKECSATADLLEANIVGAAGTGALATAIGGPLAWAVDVAAIIYGLGVAYTIAQLRACANLERGATLSKTMVGYSVNPW